MGHFCAWTAPGSGRAGRGGGFWPPAMYGSARLEAHKGAGMGGVSLGCSSSRPGFEGAEYGTDKCLGMAGVSVPSVGSEFDKKCNVWTVSWSLLDNNTSFY